MECRGVYRTIKGWGRGKGMFYSKVNDNKKICTVLSNWSIKRTSLLEKRKVVDSND
jgi:hypothetical protein